MSPPASSTRTTIGPSPRTSKMAARSAAWVSSSGYIRGRAPAIRCAAGRPPSAPDSTAALRTAAAEPMLADHHDPATVGQDHRSGRRPPQASSAVAISVDLRSRTRAPSWASGCRCTVPAVAVQHDLGADRETAIPVTGAQDHRQPEPAGDDDGVRGGRATGQHRHRPHPGRAVSGPRPDRDRRPNTSPPQVRRDPVDQLRPGRRARRRRPRARRRPGTPPVRPDRPPAHPPLRRRHPTTRRRRRWSRRPGGLGSGPHVRVGQQHGMRLLELIAGRSRCAAAAMAAVESIALLPPVEPPTVAVLSPGAAVAAHDRAGPVRRSPGRAPPVPRAARRPRWPERPRPDGGLPGRCPFARAPRPSRRRYAPRQFTGLAEARGDQGRHPRRSDDGVRADGLDLDLVAAAQGQRDHSQHRPQIHRRAVGSGQPTWTSRPTERPDQGGRPVGRAAPVD